jgi:hypothetical protein
VHKRHADHVGLDSPLVGAQLVAGQHLAPLRPRMAPSEAANNADNDLPQPRTKKSSRQYGPRQPDAEGFTDADNKAWA